MDLEEELKVPVEEAEELEEPEEDTSEAEGDDAEESEEGEEPEAEEGLSIQFEGDESEDEKSEAAPAWARELRKKHREDKKELRELKAKLAEHEGAKQKAALGDKPTLEGSDYNEERYSSELAAWFKRKAEHEAEQAKQKEQEAEQERKFYEKLEVYGDKQKELGVKDFKDAEDEVKVALSPARQSMILDAVPNAALTVYALGKNPEKLQQLSQITNDVQFIAELVRMDSKMKVSGVKKKPAPEKRIAPSGSVPGSSAAKLEKLRARAEKTGDLTEVLRFKAQMRSQNKG